MRHERTLSASALCILSGCSALFDYPDSRDESSAALCSNGLDDDFDGLADCNDASCDGHCAETGSACSDGRNNDGDVLAGVPLVDGADPGCWALGHRVTRQCAFRPGTTLELRRWTEFEAFPNLEWVTLGTVELRATIYEKDVIRLLPRQFIESRAPVSGALADMGMDVHAFLVPGSEMVLSFVSGRLGVVAEAHVVWAETADASRMWIETPSGARSNETSAGIVERFGSFTEFNFYTNGGHWRLRSVDPNISVAAVPIAPTIPGDEPLTVRVEARGEAVGASVLVEVLSTARASFDTCDRAHLSPLINAPSFRAVAEGPDLRCIILGQRAHASTNGESWEASRSTIAAGDVALTWVDAFQRFEGARLDPESGTIRFFASEDCDVFRESEPVALVDLVDLASPRLVGFDDDTSRDGGSRRLHLLGVDGAGAWQLVELASVTGAPDSYTRVGGVAWSAPVWDDGPPLTAGRLGNSLWVAGPDADTGNVALFVATDSLPVRVQSTLLAPSGEVGAFDRFRVQGARLVPLTPIAEGAALPARVYYWGSLQPEDPGYDVAAVRSGVEWREIVFGEEAQ
ncbi:MAG: hypothetical protein KC668_12670 [Myxococcales bacterium]|nr:hypothetical protein [Myxococcales bacterium]